VTEAEVRCACVKLRDCATARTNGAGRGRTRKPSSIIAKRNHTNLSIRFENGGAYKTGFIELRRRCGCREPRRSRELENSRSPNTPSIRRSALRVAADRRGGSGTNFGSLRTRTSPVRETGRSFATGSGCSRIARTAGTELNGSPAAVGATAAAISCPRPPHHPPPPPPTPPPHPPPHSVGMRRRIPQTGKQRGRYLLTQAGMATGPHTLPLPSRWLMCAAWNVYGLAFAIGM